MKIFGIGFNKTGTSSLSQIFRNNNFKVAPQHPFECNLESYFYKNYSTFTEMIKNDHYRRTFFQDAPFSFPNFYKFLDKEFPNSKFILTIRDNDEEWYQSLIRFYKKMFPNFNQPELINGYVYEGMVYKILTQVYNAPPTHPYDKTSLKNTYENHIKEVTEYFSHRDNLLIINIKDPNLITKLETFLDISLFNKNIPHLNRSI